MSRYGDEVTSLATALRDPGDLDELVERAGPARVVLLGAASHEFHTWRSVLTRRLIEEYGFSFVAVEGDWPDCARVDRSVRGLPGEPREALLTYDRWPTLRSATSAGGCGRTTGVGFHGLDVYSLWESLREILVYLRDHDPDQVPAALAAYRCFEPYAEDPQSYAWATRFVAATCEPEVVDLLVRLRERDAAQAGEFAALAGAEHRPDRGNYAPTVLGERYDAFLWFDETRAVRPLHPAAPLSGDLRVPVG